MIKIFSRHGVSAISCIVFRYCRNVQYGTSGPDAYVHAGDHWSEMMNSLQILRRPRLIGSVGPDVCLVQSLGAWRSIVWDRRASLGPAVVCCRFTRRRAYLPALLGFHAAFSTINRIIRTKIRLNSLTRSARSRASGRKKNELLAARKNKASIKRIKQTNSLTIQNHLGRNPADHKQNVSLKIIKHTADHVKDVPMMP